MKYITILFLTLLISVTQAQQLPVVEYPSFKPDTFNITSYGAKADGITLNTKAIEKAIDDCNKKGGGVVVIPKGFWLTGPITMKSNVNLHLKSGSVLQFSSNTDDYQLIKTNWEGLDAIRCQSPIYGDGLENIGITGSGIIDGAGQVWRPVKKNKLTPPEWEALVSSGGFLNEKKDTWYPTERALKGSKEKRPGVIAEGYDFVKAETIKEFLRPNMVSLIHCKKILLEGVTFQNSPAWCLHPLLSQHLTVRNVTVRNPWNAQNGDGIDVESCRYVLIENSSFDVGDDGICIKSGRDEEGRKRGVPTEDVIVRGCTVFHGHGGFVVGSEMSGGARNIHVYDCNFLGTDIGLRFKTTRGRGGIVEKIYINNIRMNNIGGAAILFDMYYMAKDPLTMFGGADKPVIGYFPVTEATPQFKDIHIKDVVCKGAETAIFVRGLPEMNVKGITMENISIESQKGMQCIECEDVKIKNVTLHTNDNAKVVEVSNGKNLTFDKVSYKPTSVFMTVAGAGSKEIQLININASTANKQVLLEEGLSDKIVKTKK
ncbi:glycoside hydrolase family 28 protein [Chryseosolibacter indicus]|uniref:Glycoside hydrolase family 28 protein n=1 Tax=Chryseosolibacter indicus TaxID=2782351 RepID=A0ABS5VT70_9BACT|nr:glycoside hydrolase family 28 protein [Chryseosolibacter indicus]MBT1704030.1 glycoside hydrolase family 28 protein [Chryseosolibacter indicus]